MSDSSLQKKFYIKNLAPEGGFGYVVAAGFALAFVSDDFFVKKLQMNDAYTHKIIFWRPSPGVTPPFHYCSTIFWRVYAKRAAP